MGADLIVLTFPALIQSEMHVVLFIPQQTPDLKQQKARTSACRGVMWKSIAPHEQMEKMCALSEPKGMTGMLSFCPYQIQG